MKIIAAFSPLAFAVAHASTHENGLLFIQTQNNGSDSRYHAELADVGGDILNIISDHDLAIVTDMSFAEANAMLSAIAAEYNEGSCISFAAMFIKHNGQIAAAWWGGQDGKILSDDQQAVHVMLWTRQSSPKRPREHPEGNKVV